MCVYVYNQAGKDFFFLWKLKKYLEVIVIINLVIYHGFRQKVIVMQNTPREWKKINK